MESGYAANSYHNAMHATDVLQSVHVLLHSGGLVGTYADPLTLLGCYLAAIVHDYEHPGLNNDFLIATHRKLALRYNDRAPLENHHAAAGLALLHAPATAFLPALSCAEMAAVRKLVSEPSNQPFARPGRIARSATRHAVWCNGPRLSSTRLIVPGGPSMLCKGHLVPTVRVCVPSAQVVDLVLGTDMKQHFAILGSFKASVLSEKPAATDG